MYVCAIVEEKTCNLHVPMHARVHERHVISFETKLNVDVCAILHKQPHNVKVSPV